MQVDAQLMFHPRLAIKYFKMQVGCSFQETLLCGTLPISLWRHCSAERCLSLFHVVNAASTAATVYDLRRSQFIIVVPQIDIAPVATHSECSAAARAPTHALDASVEKAMRVRDGQRLQHVDEQPIFQLPAVTHTGPEAGPHHEPVVLRVKINSCKHV